MESHFRYVGWVQISRQGVLNSCPASLENEVGLGEFQEKEILLTCFSNRGQNLPGFHVCCLTEAWLSLSFFMRSAEILTPTSPPGMENIWYSTAEWSVSRLGGERTGTHRSYQEMGAPRGLSHGFSCVAISQTILIRGHCTGSLWFTLSGHWEICADAESTHAMAVVYRLVFKQAWHSACKGHQPHSP